MVLIAYTHTDMKDVWPVFFGRLKKYLPNHKLYIFVNEDSELLPEDSIKVLYDDSLKYTQRISQCINSVSEDVILFLHEDMVLYDEPKFDYLEKYERFVLDEKANGIKLICSTPDGVFIKSEIDDTLVSGAFSKFSIQPTIIKTKTFKDIFDGKKNSIWEFEDKTDYNELHFMARTGNEKKRGIYHYDSIVFPYIATAINKGKWNITEYQKELNVIFEEYNINPFDRGIW